MVGIYSDETINNLKGSNFPIQNLHERVLNILAMKYVDEVIIGAPWLISEQFITNMNINLVLDANL